MMLFAPSPEFTNPAIPPIAEVPVSSLTPLFALIVPLFEQPVIDVFGDTYPAIPPIDCPPDLIIEPLSL